MILLSTLKFLLYIPYVGPVPQYIAMYCRTGIRAVRIIGTLE